MREPPLNPFKTDGAQPEEIVMPEIPQRIATPVMAAPVQEVGGNGHNPDVDEQAIVEKAEEERRRKEDQEAIDLQRREADEAKIPGNKFLLNVEPRHLPETSRLNEREIFTFGVGNVQDEVLNLNRTDSVYTIFRDAILRLKISLGGKGRDDFIALHQAEAEENARRGQIDGL